MKAILKRELRAYFQTPIGYIFIGMFLVLSGIFFILYTVQSGYPTLDSVLYNLLTVFIFLVPILTMRSFSEERNKKTDQLLLTSPASVREIVLGKFFAAAAVYIITLLLTLLYLIVIARHGEPAYLQTLCSYIGFALLGLTFISIGLFVSSCTENQIVAAIVTFALLLMFYVIGSLKDSVSSPFLSAILSALALTEPFSTFNVGILALAPTVYYISVTALLLFFTEQVVESRRWK